MNNNKSLPFPKRIKELRLENEWKQADLAKIAQLDKNMISHYETGKYTPSAEVLIKLAEAFDTSVDYFLFENVRRKPLKQKTDQLNNNELDLLMNIKKLTEKEQESITYIINSLVTKNMVKELINQAS